MNFRIGNFALVGPRQGRMGFECQVESDCPRPSTVSSENQANITEKFPNSPRLLREITRSAGELNVREERASCALHDSL